MVTFEVGLDVALAQTKLGASSIGAYFDYGKSYEGKLRRLAATPDLPSDSILYAGWIAPETFAAEPRDVDVTIYGSSFAEHAANALSQLRPSLRRRLIVGPAAPLNHTYGAYQLDRGERSTKVAVISAVSISVPEVVTMNRGSIYGDVPYPFFYPRYDVVDGRIARTGEVFIHSPGELLRAFTEDPGLWEKQREQLLLHDDAYRPLLFDEDALDESALGRATRRALAKRHQQDWLSAVHDAHGFHKDNHAVLVYQALLHQFIRDVRAEGIRPLVVGYTTAGFGDDFDAINREVTDAERAPYLSTVATCPPADATSFQADGHFTDECDLKLGRVLLDAIDMELAAAQRHAQRNAGSSADANIAAP